MSAPETLFRLRAATFGYGASVVLSGVDLEIRRGELLGIVGPNGSGKTTLFRGLLGLIEPRAGSLERAPSRLAYVPQGERLDDSFPLSTEEVVLMGAYGRLSGWRRPSRADRELARACLAEVELADRARRAFATLSGGQRQRALIARALVTRPDALLLDEPTSGVDLVAERRVLDLLERLNADRALTVLLVSHHVAAVRERLRDVLWVGGGGVRRGAARELLGAEGLERLYATGQA